MVYARILYRSGSFEELSAKNESTLERKINSREPAHVRGFSLGGGGDRNYHAMRTKAGRVALLKTLNHSACNL